MNKTVKRALLIAGGVVAACGIIWGGLTLARNAQRGNVDVYAVSDFAMTDYWGDTSQTSGMVSTDKCRRSTSPAPRRSARSMWRRGRLSRRATSC